MGCCTQRTAARGLAVSVPAPQIGQTNPINAPLQLLRRVQPIADNMAHHLHEAEPGPLQFFRPGIKRRPDGVHVEGNDFHKGPSLHPVQTMLLTNIVQQTLQLVALMKPFCGLLYAIHHQQNVLGENNTVSKGV